MSLNRRKIAIANALANACKLRNARLREKIKAVCDSLTYFQARRFKQELAGQRSYPFCMRIAGMTVVKDGENACILMHHNMWERFDELLQKVAD